MIGPFDDIPIPTMSPRSFDDKTKTMLQNHQTQHEQLIRAAWLHHADSLRQWSHDKPCLNVNDPNESTNEYYRRIGESLKKYTNSWYKTLNCDLRKHFQDNADLKADSLEFLQALQFCPTYTGLLYRGVQNERKIDYKPDMILDWNQMTSLTINCSTALGFTGMGYQGIIFEITNAYGYMIDPYSDWCGSETEIVQLPCKLKVNFVTKRIVKDCLGYAQGSVTIVNCTIIDQTPIAFQTIRSLHHA